MTLYTFTRDLVFAATVIFMVFYPLAMWANGVANEIVANGTSLFQTIIGIGG